MKLSTLRFPLSLGLGGTLGTISGPDRVMQGVALFFATRKGGRSLVPEFGIPPLPAYPEAVPAWNTEVEAGLLLVGGVVRARVLAALENDGILRGRVYISTNGQEEIDYEFAIRPFA